MQEKKKKKKYKLHLKIIRFHSIKLLCQSGQMLTLYFCPHLFADRGQPLEQQLRDHTVSITGLVRGVILRE